MTQKERDLLLKDLCARLPYKPKIQWDCADYDLLALENCEPILARIMDDRPYSYAISKPLEEIKPYLRPMASMTENEEKELCKLSNCHLERIRCYNKKTNRCDLWIVKITNDCTPFGTFEVESKSSLVEQHHIISTIDWLNAHHFDYRGLIEKGLALEATEGMYK